MQRAEFYFTDSTSLQYSTKQFSTADCIFCSLSEKGDLFRVFPSILKVYFHFEWLSNFG